MLLLWGCACFPGCTLMWTHRPSLAPEGPVSQQCNVRMNLKEEYVRVPIHNQWLSGWASKRQTRRGSKKLVLFRSLPVLSRAFICALMQTLGPFYSFQSFQWSFPSFQWVWQRTGKARFSLPGNCVPQFPYLHIGQSAIPGRWATCLELLIL